MMQFTNQSNKVVRKDTDSNKKKKSKKESNSSNNLLKEHGLSKNAQILME